MAIPLRGNNPSVSELTEEREVRSSADVPRYDTYPGESPEEEAVWKYRNARWNQTGARNPRLNETAEKIGSAVGGMVNRAQDARRKISAVQDDARRSSGSKVDEIKQRAQEKWSSATEAAQQRLDDWKQTARESAENVKDVVRRRTREAREKTGAYVDENPHHVILGIAGAAFAVGLAARIWRSQRD